jgi:hypothetical protein
MAVNWRYYLQGGYNVTGTGGRSAALRYGDTGMPSNLFSLADGTTSDKANQLYYYPISLPATTGVTLDMKGGTGEKDVLDATMALVELRAFEIWISTTAATGVSLRFGPQGVTDAWQGPFAGVAAGDYITVRQRLCMNAPADGTWTVGATTKQLRIYNPGASTVAGTLIVAGTTS